MDGLPETHVVEEGMRELRAFFGENYVPLDCCVLFFDDVYEWLSGGGGLLESPRIPEACLEM